MILLSIMSETKTLNELLRILNYALENEDWTSVEEAIVYVQEELGIDDFEDDDEYC